MKSINYILGDEHILNTPIKPYSDDAIGFLNSLSMALLKDIEAKRYPDIVSFAFWCRKSNILKLKKESNIESNRLGRGLVFHVAPSNIPVNFAFTYAFGLLAGNANIVRVPSKPFPQITLICKAAASVIEQYPAIKQRTAWVSYPVDDEITEYFSTQADGRVIWGGDQTVRNIKKCVANPKSVDVAFSDRYSIGIINGAEILAASEDGLKKLAEAFYNDTWLMDQNACSSPQMIIWLQASPEAKERFWNAVTACAKKKYVLQPASSVDKYLQLCNDAIREGANASLRWSKKAAYCVTLKEITGDISQYRGKCGYFYEYDVEDLTDISALITAKVQTVTYFGIEPEKLQEWVVENQLRGIDRIVPFGSAMDISVIWDGYDIIRMLSRIIKIG